MKQITFIDIETEKATKQIKDIGAFRNDGAKFHDLSFSNFLKFIDQSLYICGHNILNHDLIYLAPLFRRYEYAIPHSIDTLYFSPLLFPTKPYHNLVKDDKLQTDDPNNPVNDSIKACELFQAEIDAFRKLDDKLKRIYYYLLSDKKEFKNFFHFIGYQALYKEETESIIRQHFHQEICKSSNLANIIGESPVELAYCLAIINTGDRYSITPPWVLRNFSKVDNIIHQLRNTPCMKGCEYCNQAFDIHRGLKRFFGFDNYRTYNGEPLQQKAVAAAVNDKSLLAVFPTGGGKSITFQVPALMSGEAVKGLTVIISPLQSLMKDQVDNLRRNDITEAVAINGLLDPIERAKAIEQVKDGIASILYISPESLRSSVIEKLLLDRKIVRFVIDEAHCFSTWGQDFRVDYLYIGEFIKSLQEKKNLAYPIPVSCFTATAKQKVIDDIVKYFKNKLGLDLEVFRAGSARTNLHYRVIERNQKEKKYTTLRSIIEEFNCPTIVYVSRTKKTTELAERLTRDGFTSKAYHGKMEKNDKTENQNDFIAGKTQIMVATSAFGMGVDKKDVGLVIHYEISD